MSASDEWEVQHLTPNGWIRGGYMLDDGDSCDDEIPLGTVLSVRRHVLVGKIGAPASRRVSEIRNEHMSDQLQLNSLLAKYGQPVFGV